MHPFNTMKKVVLVAPQAIKDDAAFVGSNSATPATVDTLGWNKLYVDVTLGATDIAMAVLQLLRSDDGTNYTASTAHTYGGTGLPALPTADNDNGSFGFEIDLREFPYRYWRVQATAGNGAAGTFATVNAFLASPDEAPITNTQRGYVAIIKPS